MADDDILSGPRSRDRSAPAAADAIAFTGGLGIAFGVLLLSIDLYAHGHGRPPGVALFAVLLAAGYLALGLLPREMHPAAVTCIVAAVPGLLGWWILPHAHRFADVRPFLMLVIVGWGACWLAPRTRGRTIFVAAVLIVLWLWLLGEVAGTDAYSAAPVPSPPAHTTFSLSALTHERAIAPAPALAARRADVTIDDLDPTSPHYLDAQSCNLGIASACDALYTDAENGSDFREFADTCSGREPSGSGGQCADLEGSGIGEEPFGGTVVPGPGAFLDANTNDKSMAIGFVSSLFGVLYLGALLIFDRRRSHGLATAFVIPSVLALVTGTEALGNAAHHAWFGGLLTFVAGVAFAIVGELGGRRFTAWAGGVIAAFGVYTFASDVANLERSFSDVGTRLVRPALVAIGFGALLVAVSWLIASLASRYSRSNGAAPPPAPAVPPAAPNPLFDAPAQPFSPPWQPPAAPPGPPPAG